MKVGIENYQSIEKVEFDIEGFTVMVGTSNTGKSAIRRAIEGALWNQLGEKFVRTGQKSCEVKLEDGEHTIIWRKGGRGVNEYEIDGELKTKVDRAGAIELGSEIGFGEMRVGDVVLRPQMGVQESHMFLINTVGSAVSDVISEITRLDVIHHASRAASLDLDRAKREVKQAESEVEAAAAKYAIFDDLPGKDEVAEAEGRVASLLEQMGQLEEMEEILGEIDRERAFISEARRVLEERRPVLPSDGQVEVLQIAGEHLESVEEFDRLSSVEVFEVVVPEDSEVEVLSVATRCILERESLSRLTSVEVPRISLPEAKAGELAELSKVLAEIGELERFIGESRSVLVDFEVSIPEVGSTLEVDQAFGEVEGAEVMCQEARRALSEVRVSLDSVSETIEGYESVLGVCPVCGQGFPSSHESCSGE